MNGANLGSMVLAIGIASAKFGASDLAILWLRNAEVANFRGGHAAQIFGSGCATCDE
jgi:hypothetical protein